MGLRLFGNSSCQSCAPTPEPSYTFRALPNPNPSHYRLKRWDQIGKYLIVLVNYPDCTNYEGDKIMVYEATIEDFASQTKIDPHFCQDCFSPIVRFKPDDEGWEMAESFAYAMEGD